jgi:hypothetical protein
MNRSYDFELLKHLIQYALKIEKTPTFRQHGSNLELTDSGH